MLIKAGRNDVIRPCKGCDTFEAALPCALLHGELLQEANAKGLGGKQNKIHLLTSCSY